MPDQIRDGTGDGYLAKVDSTNRLRSRAVESSEEHAANLLGNAYNLNTGSITLTSAADTPVAYLKNNETTNLIVTAMAVGVNHSTGGSATDMAFITVVRNPTAGTTISNANAGAINSNRNYSSSNTLTADWYKGATGETMTDGDDHILFYHSDGNRLFATIEEVLPQGATLGIKIEPPASNTSMEVYVALICHLES